MGRTDELLKKRQSGRATEQTGTSRVDRLLAKKGKTLTYSAGAANTESKEALEDLRTTGTTTYRGKTYTAPVAAEKPSQVEPRKANLFDLTIGSMQRGYQNSKYGQELYKEMHGKENEAEALEALLAGDQYAFEPSGVLARGVSGAAELLGQQVRQWTDPESLMLAGGAAAAVGVAGQAGPQVLLPEEIVTMPAAFAMGMKMGGTKANFEIEAGHAYKELLDNGVSEETARAIATGVGGGNAALEALQLDELFKSFKVLQKSGAGETLLDRISKELLERGVDVAKETAQEVAQEGVTIGGTQIGSKLDTGDWAYDTEEVAGRLGDTALSSALSFGVMNVPGGVHNVVAGRETTRQSGAEKPVHTEQSALEQAAEQVARGESVTNRQAESLLTDPETAERLGIDRETMTKSQQRKAVKEGVERIASQRAGTSATEVSVDSPKPNVSRAAAQEPPVAPHSPVGSAAASTSGPRLARRAFNVRQMSDAASALGENGAKALNAAYDGKVQADEFYGGFAAYYQAGVSGMKMEEVRSQYAGKLSQSQRFAAFAAGQNDAKASLAREQRAAQFAQVAGEDSGLVFDDYVAETLDTTAADRVNTVAKMLGTRVRFVDSVKGGDANAQIIGSEVLVEKNNQNPVMFLLGHEWTHRMQELAPTEYRAFREAVAREVQGEVADILQVYRDKDVELDYEAALDEAVANYSGRMIEDGKVLDDFIERHRNDRTMLQKVLDSIRELVRKLTGAERSRAQTAVGKLEAALDASARQAESLKGNKNTALLGGGAKYNLEGVSFQEDKYFARLMDKWTELQDNKRVKVGEVRRGSALHKIGLPVSGMYFDVGKIKTAMNSHGDHLTPEILKGIPDLLNDPIVIAEYKGPKGDIKNTVSVYGNLFAEGNPVVVGIVMRLDRSGQNVVTNIRTIHARSNFAKQITDENVLYLNEDKKKTRNWFQVCGISNVPLEGTKFGPIRSIAFFDEKSKGNFSLKGSENVRELAALRKENDLLRERMDYWKGQTRKTKRVTTDKKAVEKAARELVKSYGSEVEVGDVAQQLQGLYDYIASGYEGKDELTYTEARRRAEEIGRELVARAVAVDDDLYMQYSDLRAYLRNTKLTISEADSRDIADFSDFRKRQMGRMNLGKDGIGIDQAYKELAERWPEFFDEQRESTPVDQLLHIAEVLDGIYEITEYNPFSTYIKQAESGAANEILERFFDLPQTKATFADKQEQKLGELRAQNQERVKAAILAERMAGGREMAKLKRRYEEKTAAGRERQGARELRARIIRHTGTLRQKLLRPSDKQHIPEKLRKATAAMLEAINLESAFTVDPDTGKRLKDGSGLPTKRTEAFQQLRLAYAEIAQEGKDYTLILDPDLLDNLTELEAMKDTPLMEMTTAQLNTVWATVKAVEHSIRSANKMLAASRFEHVSDFADGIKFDNLTRKDRGDFRGVVGWLDQKTNFDMLTPQGFFHRLGKTGEEMFRMMRAAQDRHIQIMHQAQVATRRIMGKADANKLEQEVHTFDLDGGTLTMSTAQIMSLYKLMDRKQAQEHILKGGIRPETIKSGKGLRESRKADPVHVTLEELASITGVLTDEQRRVADGLQRYMGGTLAELGNEASMAVYGYRKFTEKDYFPIQVDKNQTQSDNAKEAQAQTIAGRGFTKSVTPHANNAVMLNSIFDVYSTHVNDMATYAAWLPTMEDVRRVRDFTFRDGEGNRTGNVKSVVERVFGKNGNPYFNKLVDDINQGIKPVGTGGMNALVGNYKAAAVAANIRVILQQPTSILRALDCLDPKYLLAGTVKRGDWEKVMKYAPIARWKDWGYFDINTGRQMKDVLLGSDSRLEKLKQAGMAGAGKMDSFAWARLWNAVEAEMKDKCPGLKPGSDAFYKAVAQRFEEIVDRTQVVDGLLQRSQIMRSPDGLDKMATSFMGEPTKTYNMFTNAVYDFYHAEGREGKKVAQKALTRTAVALVTSFAVNAVMQSLADALRDDDKEKGYWEKFFQAYSGLSGDEESFLDYWNSFWDGNLQANFNPAGYVPYAKDILSISQGYDVARMDMEPVSKVWSAAVNMKKALTGEGKYSLKGASLNLTAETARLLGLPVANLKRDILGVLTTSAIETDSYLMQYRIDKFLLNQGSNSANFLDILYNASVNDPEAYEIIYADLVKEDQLKTATQTTQQRIASGMESRMKKAQGVESVEELETRFLSPAQQESYDKVHGQVVKSRAWKNATEKQRANLESSLYDLTVGNSDGLKMQEKISGGSAYGLDEADYLLYKLALQMVDQPSESGKLGSYTGDEVQAAIDMLSGLSDKARGYLWEAQGKSESSNPYK